MPGTNEYILASKLVGYWVDRIAAKSETQGGVSGIQMSTIVLLDCVRWVPVFSNVQFSKISLDDKCGLKSDLTPKTMIT